MGFLLRSSDWESESYPSASDFLAIPCFAIFFPLLRLFLDRFLFQKLAARLILGKGYRRIDLVTREERKAITKFKESAWKFVYFFSADMLALYVTYNEPWFTDTKLFYVGPGDHVWPDLKTKFARVGAIVLAIHDATDMFLEPAKMARYSGFESLSSVFFAVFVLVWTALRIICFPVWILRSTGTELVTILDVEKYGATGPAYYYLFNTLLICLLIVNVYWWKLMIMMVIEQIKAKGKLGDDIRSDSEGEDDDHVD
ncbi:ASC1-like protein [Linum perenne]